MLGAVGYVGAHRRDRFIIRRRLVGLATAIGVTVLMSTLLGIPIAVGAHEPIIVPGNPTCEVGEFSFKDDDGPLSAATNGDVTITYSDSTHTTVAASSGFTIDQVIVKAGSSAAIYSTPPFTDLASIINNGGPLAEISHVEVCYSTASTTTTTDASTTTTDPSTTTTDPPTTTTDPPTTTTDPPTTTTATEPTTTTTAPTTTTTTTDPPTTTTGLDVGGSTSTTQPTSTTTATTQPDPTTTTDDGGSNNGSAPPVSVLPTGIDQTELPQTGLGDAATGALGAALVIAGAGVLLVAEQRARTRRTALLRRL